MTITNTNNASGPSSSNSVIAQSLNQPLIFKKTDNAVQKIENTFGIKLTMKAKFALCKNHYKKSIADAICLAFENSNRMLLICNCTRNLSHKEDYFSPNKQDLQAFINQLLLRHPQNLNLNTDHNYKGNSLALSHKINNLGIIKYVIVIGQHNMNLALAMLKSPNVTNKLNDKLFGIIFNDFLGITHMHNKVMTLDNTGIDQNKISINYVKRESRVLTVVPEYIANTNCERLLAVMWPEIGKIIGNDVVLQNLLTKTLVDIKKLKNTKLIDIAEENNEIVGDLLGIIYNASYIYTNYQTELHNSITNINVLHFARNIRSDLIKLLNNDTLLHFFDFTHNNLKSIFELHAFFYGNIYKSMRGDSVNWYNSKHTNDILERIGDTPLNQWNIIIQSWKHMENITKVSDLNPCIDLYHIYEDTIWLKFAFSDTKMQKMHSKRYLDSFTSFIHKKVNETLEKNPNENQILIDIKKTNPDIWSKLDIFEILSLGRIVSNFEHIPKILPTAMSIIPKLLKPSNLKKLGKEKTNLELYANLMQELPQNYFKNEKCFFGLSRMQEKFGVISKSTNPIDLIKLILILSKYDNLEEGSVQYDLFSEILVYLNDMSACCSEISNRYEEIILELNTLMQSPFASILLDIAKHHPEDWKKIFVLGMGTFIKALPSSAQQKNSLQFQMLRKLLLVFINIIYSNSASYNFSPLYKPTKMVIEISFEKYNISDMIDNATNASLSLLLNFATHENSTLWNSLSFEQIMNISNILQYFGKLQENSLMYKMLEKMIPKLVILNQTELIDFKDKLKRLTAVDATSNDINSLSQIDKLNVIIKAAFPINKKPKINTLDNKQIQITPNIDAATSLASDNTQSNIPIISITTTHTKKNDAHVNIETIDLTDEKTLKISDTREITETDTYNFQNNDSKYIISFLEANNLTRCQQNDKKAYSDFLIFGKKQINTAKQNIKLAKENLSLNKGKRLIEVEFSDETTNSDKNIEVDNTSKRMEYHNINKINKQIINENKELIKDIEGAFKYLDRYKLEEKNTRLEGLNNLDNITIYQILDFFKRIPTCAQFTRLDNETNIEQRKINGFNLMVRTLNAANYAHAYIEGASRQYNDRDQISCLWGASINLLQVLRYLIKIPDATPSSKAYEAQILNASLNCLRACSNDMLKNIYNILKKEKKLDDDTATYGKIWPILKSKVRYNLKTDNFPVLNSTKNKAQEDKLWNDLMNSAYFIALKDRPLPKKLIEKVEEMKINSKIKN